MCIDIYVDTGQIECLLVMLTILIMTITNTKLINTDYDEL